MIPLRPQPIRPPLPPRLRRRMPSSRTASLLRFAAGILLLTFGVLAPFFSALAAPPPGIALGAVLLPTARIAPLPTPQLVPLPTADPGRILIPPPTPDVVPNATPTPTPEPGVPLSGPVPILMYHYIRTVTDPNDQLGYNLSVAPELFEQHVAWLAANGYRGVRMDTLRRCLNGEPICPPRPVALTFDDGYMDAYTDALPILQRYGFPATFYITTDFVEQRGYMGWEQLAALRAAGMEIGSHSVSHNNMTELDAAALERETRLSKRLLEERLGIQVLSFCYPIGAYNAAAIEAVRAAGYTSAVTTRWDNDYADLLALPRRRIAGGQTTDELAWIVGN